MGAQFPLRLARAVLRRCSIVPAATLGTAVSPSTSYAHVRTNMCYARSQRMPRGAASPHLRARSGQTSSTWRPWVTPETRLCSTERCRSPPLRTRPFGELLAGTGERHISGRGISLGEVGRVDFTALCAPVGEYELLRPPEPELATGRRSFEGKGAARDDSESGSTADVAADARRAMLLGYVGGGVSCFLWHLGGAGNERCVLCVSFVSVWVQCLVRRCLGPSCFALLACPINSQSLSPKIFPG